MYTKLPLISVDTDHILWYAIDFQTPDDVQSLLLKSGTDVNTKSPPLPVVPDWSAGRLPLTVYSLQGNNHMVSFLIKAGANVHAVDSQTPWVYNQRTALMRCCMQCDIRHCDVVRTLLANGADPHAVDCDGVSSFDWASDSFNGCSNPVLPILNFHDVMSQLRCRTRMHQLFEELIKVVWHPAGSLFQFFLIDDQI